MDNDTLSISEAAAKAGTSVDTLRYYEKEGLIPPPARVGGRRRYRPDDVGWVVFLTRMRATGMPIALMRRYAELSRAGDSTVADRLALLETHRDTVRERLAAVQADLAAIDFKVANYRKVLR